MHHNYLIIAILVAFTSCVGKSGQSGDIPVGRTLDYIGTLDFLDATDSLITSIEIAVANDDKSRSEGLMDVRFMKPDGGMLFTFPFEAEQSFWMANTPLSLDLIFASGDGVIVHIHHNAVPYSRQSIQSVYPASYVVEVNAGFAIKHDLKPGYRIRYQY